MFKKGHIGYWKGKKRPKRDRDKISKSHKIYWNNLPAVEKQKIIKRLDHRSKKGEHPVNEFKKGHAGYWKDKKLSKEHKAKLSKALKKNPPSTVFKKGMETWCKGQHCLQLSGSNHWNWKGGITKLGFRIRNLPIYNSWRIAIYAKNDYTCQKCGKRKNRKGVFIVAHHKKSFKKIMKENNIKTITDAIKCKELWDVSNGVTLCVQCHNSIEKKKIKKKL